MKQALLAVVAACTLVCAPQAQALIAVNAAGADLSASVVQTSATTWDYSYTLINTTECRFACGDTLAGKPILTYALSIRGFDLPFFADYGSITTSSITAPTGWSWTVVDTPFQTQDGGSITGSQTLRWTANESDDQAGVAVGASLGGFGFTASFAAGYAPYSVSIPSAGKIYGDPPIPLSPAAAAAGIQPLTAAVPEPETYALMALGLAALGLARRRAA